MKTLREEVKWACKGKGLEGLDLWILGKLFWALVVVGYVFKGLW